MPPLHGDSSSTASSTPLDASVTLVGGGKMGRALLQGAIAAGVVDPQRLTVVDPDANSQAWWTREIPAAQVTEDCRAGVTRGEIVILAVKPQTLGAVAATPADWDQRLTISVAAGIQL